MRLAKAFVILAVAAAACAPQAGQVGSSAFASAAPSSPSPSSISLASPSPLVSLPPTAAPCPTESPMSVARYLHADRACFGARDVTLTGWEDLPEGLGGVDLGIEPSWLATTSPPWAFLMDRLGQECGQGCGSLAVHVDPSSALRFERDGHWVVVTGHRNDTRAETCVAPASSDPGTPTHEEIVQTCRNAFVLTSVRDAVAPSGALPSCPSDAALRIAAYLDADPACFAGRDVTL